MSEVLVGILGFLCIIAIVVTIPSGIIIGWLDALWCVLFGHLVLCD